MHANSRSRAHDKKRTVCSLKYSLSHAENIQVNKCSASPLDQKNETVLLPGSSFGAVFSR